MSNAKKAEVSDSEPKPLPITRPSIFSKFGGQRAATSGPKFSPKTFSARPTFVTQHKGGGGK